MNRRKLKTREHWNDVELDFSRPDKLADNVHVRRGGDAAWPMSNE